MNKELYDILGVNSDATAEEIKKAYKKMALIWHPDKCKDDSAAEKFQQLHRANEILSDPEKREIYDKFGLNVANEQSTMYGESNGCGIGSRTFPSFFRKAGNVEKRTVTEQLLRSVTLVELFSQNKIDVKFPRKIRCNPCDATGFKDRRSHLCARCNGTGKITHTVLKDNHIYQGNLTCMVCNGNKKDMNAPICKICVGTGIIESENIVKIDVPRNILKENVVSVSGEGSWSDGLYANLSIVLNLDLSESKNFSLSDDNILTYTMDINFSESVCGFTRIIDHPSGKKICIVSNLGYIINPDMVYVLDKLGIHSKYDASTKRTPLHLIFSIHYPENIVIPDSKKIAFTYKNLGKILGGKFEPDSIMHDADLTYNLHSLEKYNKLHHESYKNPYTPYNNQYFGQTSNRPTCDQSNTQPTCSQQ